MAELAEDLFGLELSVGTVDAICQRGATALEEPHERLTAAVLCSPALNVDETGRRTAATLARSGPRPRRRRQSSESRRTATATGWPS
jgi:hypothetical protein